MKKQFALTLLLVPALAACGGGAPTAPTTSSVSINSASQLEINAPTKATAAAKDANGNTLNGKTITWTSSDPTIVAVAADGALTAKKLSASPVQITATVDGKSVSANVTTYGLEVTGGTYNNTISKLVGTHFLIRFREADQTGPDAAAPVTIQGPAAFNGGQAFTGTQTLPLKTNVTEVRFGGAYYSAVTPVDGEYTASTVVNGKTFTSKFSIDADMLLPAMQNPVVNLTASGYTLTGTAGTGVTYVQALVFHTGTSTTTTLSLLPVSSLPASREFTSQQMPSGTYNTYVRSYNVDLNNATGLTPAQSNVAMVAAGTVTF
ncbi:hypothetical protein [Deinococcus peraridilitoris]|uniref:Ig-like domain-containing protein n=1 Tax=Deinococcus peraridilitoris (strain DSM 19664 / LMG 22246 / CIP 109416 / KR-200) TaxID=937777 RepID=K9ZZH4_DEIPD|nr:hypothetical protein [Deinococcus peraridilitoris]AFZ67048.1 hypothetical protein Deipe_1507 [Deinococcus peraridilitoris DSM 19664]